VATLGANLYQLYLAGSRDLPKGADVYKTIQSDLEAASSHPDMGMWWSAMECTSAVFGWAETNLRDAGGALCLIAYELADTDEAAKQELLRSAGLDELPPHGDDEWINL
jgi:hypothetical protein